MTSAADAVPTHRPPALLRPLLGKGRGLNSIPIRFTLLAALCSAAGAYVLANLVLPMHATAAPALYGVLLGLVIVAPAAVTFLAARKLTGTILALRHSTDAIARGDASSPIDVDCACEVGDLADSFRAMVRRLNGNILRMNVLAYIDPVTHLPNRSVVNHVLGLLKHQGSVGDRRAALFFIDLDAFKRINDTLGHEAGDRLLGLVVERLIDRGLGLGRDGIDDCTNSFGELRGTFPDRPVLARFASQEFILLLPGQVEEAALRAVATGLLESLAAPFEVAGSTLHVGARIGIARLPLDTTDPEQLLGYADLAVDAAKRAGEERIRFFDGALLAECLAEARIEQDLGRAIENDELVLHFQPKVDCRTHAVTGVEALVRWIHPEEGVIPPARFIPIAERGNHMVALGGSVLRLAVRQLQAWQEQGLAIRLAVNVSTVQIEQPCFVPKLLGLLAAHDVDPHLLDLEVTETMVMSGVDAVQERLQALRAAGIRIAIDDFGTGYSNLSQIAALPSDCLKLDRSLVEGLGRDRKAGTIVAATIGMAHALGHRVVAEGIEDGRQLETLVELGCDEAQGFLFARPMPAPELERWLAARQGEARPQAA